MIEKYREESTGQTIGFSKWNFPSGEAELRECIVFGYIKKQDLYEIRWCHNPEIQKKVSRFNLIFKSEDAGEYERARLKFLKEGSHYPQYCGQRKN